MNKTAWAAMLLLLGLAIGAFAELGLGLSIAFPMELGMRGLDPVLLAGFNARWKSSWFLVDAGYSLLLEEDGSCGFLDLGLCFDLCFVRLGFAGGLYGARWPDSPGPPTQYGSNIKANLDLKLGRVSVGLSGSFPLGRELDPGPWLIANQYGLNVLYWLGPPPPPPSRRR